MTTCKPMKDQSPLNTYPDDTYKYTQEEPLLDRRDDNSHQESNPEYRSHTKWNNSTVTEDFTNVVKRKDGQYILPKKIYEA